MTKNQKILIQLVKYALKGEKLPDEYRNLSTEEKKSVIEFSREQALVPFCNTMICFQQKMSEICLSHILPVIFFRTADSRQNWMNFWMYLNKIESTVCH